MTLLPLITVLIFDMAALGSGIFTLVLGYRLDKIVPLKFIEMALPLYVVGGFITWYGGLALFEDIFGISPSLHIELQSLVMAIIGIMLANVFWALYRYARTSVGKN